MNEFRFVQFTEPCSQAEQSTLLNISGLICENRSGLAGTGLGQRRSARLTIEHAEKSDLLIIARTWLGRTPPIAGNSCFTSAACPRHRPIACPPTSRANTDYATRARSLFGRDDQDPGKTALPEMRNEHVQDIARRHGQLSMPALWPHRNAQGGRLRPLLALDRRLQQCSFRYNPFRARR